MEREERAHRIRMDLLSRPGLLERLQAALEAYKRGDVITLAELNAGNRSALPSRVVVKGGVL
jgi:hypothetical protein